MTTDPLRASRSLWNRGHFDLESDESLAQLMDRGELPAWQRLCELARDDRVLRARMHRVVYLAPLALPHFWLALLAGMGEVVDYDAVLPAMDDGP